MFVFFQIFNNFVIKRKKITLYFVKENENIEICLKEP